MDLFKYSRKGKQYPENFTVPVTQETKDTLERIKAEHKINVTAWARDLIETHIKDLLKQLGEK